MQWCYSFWNHFGSSFCKDFFFTSFQYGIHFQFREHIVNKRIDHHHHHHHLFAQIVSIHRRQYNDTLRARHTRLIRALTIALSLHLIYRNNNTTVKTKWHYNQTSCRRAGGRHDMPPPRPGPHTLPADRVYATDVRQTDVRQHHCLMPPGRRHNNAHNWSAFTVQRVSYCYCSCQSCASTSDRENNVFHARTNFEMCLVHQIKTAESLSAVSP